MPTGHTRLLHWARENARIDSDFLREVIAEFLGTFILCLFAVGGTSEVGIMQFRNGVFNSAYDVTNASIVSTAFGYFIVILLFGGISGAHVNPAVSVGYAIAGRLSWVKLHGYILVQFLGGYLGSLLGYGLHMNYVERVLRGASAQKISDMPYSATLFLTNSGLITVGAGFANEIVITAIFMMCIMATMDGWNTRTPRCLQGIVIGLVVIGLGFGFGQMTGVMINPVRDIAPRIAALSLGWTSTTATRGVDGNQWWSVGLFAPFIGTILGSIIYVFIIGSQLSHDRDLDGSSVPDNNNGNNSESPPPQDWRSTVFIPKPQTGRNSPHVKVQFSE